MSKKISDIKKKWLKNKIFGYEYKILGEKYNKERVKIEAKKDDGSKLNLLLVEVSFVEEMARVMAFGANKYGEGNWKKNLEKKRILGALLRHVYSILKGEDVDSESGLLHAAHAACNLMFLIWYKKNEKNKSR